MSKRPLVQRLREEPNFMFWLDIAEAADRIDELEAEVKRLREALEDVEGFLRNDKYDTRVRNALSVIDDALGG